MQSSMKNNNITQVDVRKIHFNPRRPELNNIASAVAEVAKYAVKPSDYIFVDSKILTDKVLYTFSMVLFRRRTISFCGIFYDLRKQLGFLKDINDDDDLVNTDSDELINKDSFVSISRYVWCHGNYHLYAVEVPNKFVLTCSDDNFFVDLKTGEVLVE